MITAPRLIGRDVMKADARSVQPLQYLPRFGFVVRIANVDADPLGLDEGRDHAAKGRKHPFQGARETDAVAPRPGEPGRFVRFPFGRHSVAETGWRVVGIESHKLALARKSDLANRLVDPGACQARGGEPTRSPFSHTTPLSASREVFMMKSSTRDRAK